MKKLTYIMAVLFFVFSVGGLSGCGSSDDGPDLDSLLFGTWTGVWEEGSCYITQDITFKTDGTFTYYESEDCVDDFDLIDSEQGVWHTGNGRLYVTVTQIQGNDNDDIVLNQEFSLHYVVSTDGSALAIIDGDDFEEDGLVMIESRGGIVGEWQSQYSGDTLTINSDMTWSISANGYQLTGSYEMEGNMITLTVDGDDELVCLYAIIDSRLYIISEDDGLLFKE